MTRRTHTLTIVIVLLFLLCFKAQTAHGDNLANLWVSPSGGSCTRSASPAAFNAATACGSYGAAYNAAAAGDLVYVKAGTYGSQTVPARSLGSSVVTLMQEPGGGRVTTTGDLDIEASNVVVDGFYGTTLNTFNIGSNPGCSKTPGNGWPCTFPTKNVTLRNFNFNYGWITGDTILLQHGSVGPVEACNFSNAEDGIQILGAGNGVNSSWTPSVNITVDDVTVHDVTNNGCGKHTDGIQGFGYRHLTVRNSRIYNTDSSFILAYSFDNANPLQVDTVLIENSAFGTIANPGHGITLGNDGTSASCGASNLNNVIQNNTFYGNMGADVNCAGSPDAVYL